MSIGWRDLFEEAFALMAADLRAARLDLGITLTGAAERAGLDHGRYRSLERNSGTRGADDLDLMVSAARGLGLEEVRFSYVEEVQRYMKLDLTTARNRIVFVDTLRLDARDLKRESVFVSPYRVLTLVERIGASKTLASRQLVDKQLGYHLRL